MVMRSESDKWSHDALNLPGETILVNQIISISNAPCGSCD